MQKNQHTNNMETENKKSESKWIMVTFTCSNGWEKVTTSIPKSEMENDKHYLEKQGFNDVKNINYENQND